MASSLFVLLFLTVHPSLCQTQRDFPLPRQVPPHWLEPFIWTPDIMIPQHRTGLADNWAAFWPSAHPTGPTSASLHYCCDERQTSRAVFAEANISSLTLQSEAISTLFTELGHQGAVAHWTIFKMVLRRLARNKWGSSRQRGMKWLALTVLLPILRNSPSCHQWLPAEGNSHCSVSPCAQFTVS